MFIPLGYNLHSQTLRGFLEAYSMPRLSPSDSEILNAPLSEEENLKALAQTHCGRAPGSDGLPAEVYKKYAPQLVRMLLKVYSEALQNGRLPSSMNEQLL